MLKFRRHSAFSTIYSGVIVRESEAERAARGNVVLTATQAGAQGTHGWLQHVRGVYGDLWRSGVRVWWSVV